MHAREPGLVCHRLQLIAVKGQMFIAVYRDEHRVGERDVVADVVVQSLPLAEHLLHVEVALQPVGEVVVESLRLRLFSLLDVSPVSTTKSPEVLMEQIC